MGGRRRNNKPRWNSPIIYHGYSQSGHILRLCKKSAQEGGAGVQCKGQTGPAHGASGQGGNEPSGATGGQSSLARGTGGTERRAGFAAQVAGATAFGVARAYGASIPIAPSPLTIRVSALDSPGASAVQGLGSVPMSSRTPLDSLSDVRNPVHT